jgi:hypothetical protein
MGNFAYTCLSVLDRKIEHKINIDDMGLLDSWNPAVPVVQVVSSLEVSSL